MTEPSAGDVEALADVIFDALRAKNPLHYNDAASELADAVLASDWLAILLAEVRRAAGEQIAQAIEERAVVAEKQRAKATTTAAHDASDEHAWAFYHAARIAREVTRGTD